MSVAPSPGYRYTPYIGRDEARASMISPFSFHKFPTDEATASTPFSLRVMHFARPAVQVARTFRPAESRPFSQIIRWKGFAAGHEVGAAVACGKGPIRQEQKDVWQTALSLMKGAAAAVFPLLGWTRPRPIDGWVLTLAEVQAIREQGFEIVFCQTLTSSKCQKYIFRARLNGRTVGQLDIDFIGARRWLYVANVYVVETQGNRRVGTALLVGAAKTTDCKLLTTSARTRQGVRFFAKNRPVLKRYGIEMRDRPPALPAPVPSHPTRASASPSAAR